MLQERIGELWHRMALLVILIFSLAACSDFEPDTGVSGSASAPTTLEALGEALATSGNALDDGEIIRTSEVSGSVGDGPIIGAAIQILAKDGSLLASMDSGFGAGYNLTIRTKGKYFPLTIEAQSGIDLVTGLVPDFKLYSALLAPRKKAVANLNPFTSIAFQIARDLPGGLTTSNIDAATRRDFDLPVDHRVRDWGTEFDAWSR